MSLRRSMWTVASAAVGTAAEASRSGKRRANGLVYTPAHLVDFILDAAGYVSKKPLDRVGILDPACGAGVFLVAALERLSQSLEEQGAELRSARGAREFERLARENVRGIDIDPRACKLTRAGMAEKFSELTGTSASRGAFTRSVLCGDYLAPSGPVRRFATTGRDVVVGNPPYVTTTRLGKEEKASYRSRFESAHGRVDLYQLFMEQAIRDLSPSSRLAFITPNKFLTSQSGKALRSLMLRSGSLTTVANFSSHRVFEDAATVPCITVFEKGVSPSDFESLDCGPKPGSDGRIPVLRRRHVRQKTLSSDAWHLADARLQALAERMMAKHPALEAFAERISAGMATGLDALFVSPEPRGLEPEVVRPVVRGRDIDAFSVTRSSLEVLLPYSFSSDGTDPELVDLRRYPRAQKLLQPHRSRLEQRHCVRVWSKAWYDVHDPVPFDVARARKILVPDVADRNRFALDEGKVLPLHSAYYIIPKGIDPEYLTALLNSAPLTFLARLRAPVVKDGFSRYRRQFLAGLPVPRPGRKLEREIASAGFGGDQERLDELCARALSLTKTGVRSLTAFIRRTRAEASRRR